MEDKELVIRAKAGDERSFEVLLKRYKGKIYNTVFRILRDRDDAMDIAMEAFFIAYKRLGSLREETKFSSWLIGIARNLALMRLRSKKTEISIQDPKFHGTLSIPFDDEISREEVKRLIKREIEKLPHKYREAFILREIKGYPYGKITKELGITQTNAKVRVSRAKKLLRTKLKRLL